MSLTRDDKHFYEAHYIDLAQGKQPGITTCIGVLDKPALVGWAKRETAIAALRNWGTLQSMIAQYPVNDEALATHPAVSFLKGVPGYQRDAAADIGTRVHAVAEAMQRGEDPIIEDDVAPFADAYVRDFLTRYQPTFHPLYTECMVYHSGQDGTVLPYGGTMDVICRIKDPVLDAEETWLIDFKTSKSGVYPETGLQLAAGRYAEFIGRPGDPKRYPVPKVDRCGVVWIRPEGAHLIEYRVSPQEFQAFTACRLLWHWVHERAQEVKAA